MTEEESKRIIDKVSKDTIADMGEIFKYWQRSTNHSGIKLTKEHCMDYVDEIMNKKVSELTSQEQLIMLIHFLLGDCSLMEEEKKYPELTDEELNCIKSARGFIKVFAHTNFDMLNHIINKDGDRINVIKMKRLLDLSTSELLLFVASIDW